MKNNKKALLALAVALLVSLFTHPVGATPTDKFEGTIIFDKAYAGFHIFKIDGAHPQKAIQLTQKNKQHYEDYEEPTWSPDGRKIAFVVKEGPLERQNIFIMDADGKNITKLTNFTKGLVFNLEWKSYRNEIDFTYNPNEPNKDILRRSINIRTGNIRDIGKQFQKIGICSSIVPSPDDKVLLCLEWLAPNKDKMTIYYSLSAGKSAEDTLRYNGTLYGKVKERILDNASQPLWSKDSSKFAVLMNDSLALFDAQGDEIVRKKQRLCNINLTCLKNWPANSDKIVFACNCGTEGTQESIYLLDTKTMKKVFISEGQNPDLYIGPK